mgnify:CR=1 FL=1
MYITIVYYYVIFNRACLKHLYSHIYNNTHGEFDDGFKGIKKGVNDVTHINQHLNK